MGAPIIPQPGPAVNRDKPYVAWPQHQKTPRCTRVLVRATLAVFQLHPEHNMPTIKRIAIYDMDGTIVDSLHRYRTINGKIDLEYWRANEYRAMQDTLLPLAEQYRRDLADVNCYVIIATARVMHEPDYKFVREILGEPDYIISRKEGDTISGGLLKIKGLQKFFNLKNFKNAAAVFYEDNTAYLKAVCDKFNIMGVYVPSQQGH